MAWSWQWPWDIFGFFRKVKDNLANGYDFGDIIKANYGFSDDVTNAEGTSDAGSFGQTLNDATGVTASNAFSAAEAEKNRDWQTAERLATQDFNSAEAERARQFQLMMENTRYSRTMNDLREAGINPMALYAGSGMSAGASGASSAASVSAGGGASGTASGNSANAVSGIIRALAGLVKVVK